MQSKDDAAIYISHESINYSLPNFCNNLPEGYAVSYQVL